ncbi:unnamed protein product, partial [Rotaria magnacalcarata]
MGSSQANYCSNNAVGPDESVPLIQVNSVGPSVGNQYNNNGSENINLLSGDLQDSDLLQQWENQAASTGQPTGHIPNSTVPTSQYGNGLFDNFYSSDNVFKENSVITNRVVRSSGQLFGLNSVNNNKVGKSIYYSAVSHSAAASINNIAYCNATLNSGSHYTNMGQSEGNGRPIASTVPLTNNTYRTQLNNSVGDVQYNNNGHINNHSEFYGANNNFPLRNDYRSNERPFYNPFALNNNSTNASGAGYSNQSEFQDSDGNQFENPFAQATPPQGTFNFKFSPPPQGGFNTNSQPPPHGGFNANCQPPPQGGFNTNSQPPPQGGFNANRQPPPQGGVNANCQPPFSQPPPQGGYNTNIPSHQPPPQGGINNNYPPPPPQGGYNHNQQPPPQGGPNSNCPFPPQGGSNFNYSCPPQGNSNTNFNFQPPQGGLNTNQQPPLQGGYNQNHLPPSGGYNINQQLPLQGNYNNYQPPPQTSIPRKFKSKLSTEFTERWSATISV